MTQLYSSVGGIAGYFYFQNAAGNTIDPRQNVIGTDHFKKLSQEFRVASPQDERFRVVAGLFYQRQSNDIHQDYQVPGLAPELSVNGFPGTLWLTQQHRVDKDYAMFGEAAFDILPNLTFTAGGRGFIYDNSLIGFFGFGRDPAYVQGATIIRHPTPRAARAPASPGASPPRDSRFATRNWRAQGRPCCRLRWRAVPAPISGPSRTARSFPRSRKGRASPTA